MAIRAFSLIEMMAVVALLGLLAAATVWMLSTDARRSSRTAIVAQVQHCDAMARRTARRLGTRISLQFDLDAQKITRVTALPRQDDGSQTMRWSDDYRIQRVVICRPIQPADTTEPWLVLDDSGIAEITISQDGISATYALLLKAPPATRSSDDSEPIVGQNQVWLLFAGLTGQMSIYHEDADIQSILEHLAQVGNDAD